MVEVLVAAAVSLLLVVSLTAVITSFLRLARRSDERADAFREARAAIQYFQRDVQSLVRLENKDPFVPRIPFLALSDLALTERRSSGTAGGEPRGGDEVHVLCARLARGAEGRPEAKDEVMAVSFYTKWNATDSAYELWRRVIKPREALKRLRDGYANSTSTPKLPKPTSVFAGADASNADVSEDLLAAYVWDLRVHSYDSGGTEIKFPSSSGTSGSAYPIIWHSTEFLAPDPPATPAFLEVSFKALSPAAGRAAAAFLRGRNASEAGEFWFTPSRTGASDADKRLYQNVVAQSLQVFHVRIPLSTP